MKKLLLILLFIYKSTLEGQTVLNSYSLDVKKYDTNNQILNVEDQATHDVFVIVTDTKNITLLKYNRALFLTNEFTLARTNLEDKSIIGYSFSEDGNPTLYWSSSDFTTILVIKYYLESKTYKILRFKYPSSSQYVVTSFQKNNTFYLLSKPVNQQTLIVYAFKNGIVEEKEFDFSGFTFQNRQTKFFTFTQILQENPIEKIESDEYNPLYKTTKKSKAYMLDNHIFLTLDYNPKKTQIFDLNLESHNLTEKNFIQSVTASPKKLSNSFFYDHKIYQINANQEELLFDIKDYDSEKIIKSVKISKNDSIRFKSSPILTQRNDQKPKELKKINKFLQRLSYTDIGLSVFKNNENTLMTLGGVPIMENVPYGVNDNFNSWGYTQTFQDESIFFESTLNSNYEFINPEQQPLAMDNINYFLDQNKKAILPNILKFKDYYILGYYDSALKQYIMRRFTDGFIPEESSNPIINKATFSKSFRVDKP